MKHTLCYLRGTLDYDLIVRRSASSELTVYTDADWAGYRDTCRCTSGYAMFLDANLVSWFSKHHNVVSRLSADAEYQAVTNGVAEAY
jgi:succinate dehydrogenase flavin-adding protein (antitoxin of CptAB toxin-antitoxin module)